MTNLMEKYCLLVHGRRGGFYLAEIIQENQPIPLVVEGLVEYNPGTQITCHDQDKLILSIILAYQEVMIDELQLSGSRSELIAIRLDHLGNTEHPSWNYRIQFPYCRIDDELRGLLRAKVLVNLQNNNILRHISSAPKNGWDTIIFEKSPSHLTLYGSADRIGMEPLDFTEVYGALSQEMVDGEVDIQPFSRKELIIPEHHTFIKEIPLWMASAKDPINFELWLPVFLSIYYGHTRTISNSNSNSSTPAGNLHLASRFGPEDWSIAKDMMEMLAPVRAHNEFFFNDIGRALHSASKGGNDGLEGWIAFGKRHQVPVQGCSDRYYKFEGTWITVKTLRFYARQDSPDAYERWLQNYRRPIMDLAAGGRHAHVAEALYETYCLDFCCSDISANNWYYFRDNRWIHIAKGYEFSKHVSKQFCHELEKHRSDVVNRQVRMEDRSEKENMEAKIKKLTTLIDKLADNSYKNRVIAEALNFFYDPTFGDRYDNAPHLLCVKSGVIEMNDTTFLFRPGKPEDYLTITTGAAYNDKLDQNSRSVVRAMVWIEQLMAEPELITTMQNFMGSIPYGGNLDKKLLIWTGPPDAGKSSFTRAINLALGKYVIKGDNGVLYNVRAGDGPSPSLARARGTRIQFYEELETERGVISSGFIKRATGNDSFFARKLHENGGEIDPLNKTIMVCNLVPQFSTFDDATKDRVYILPFNSRWVDNPPADQMEQKRTRTFKRDRQFNSQLPEYASALLWLMINWYPKYMREGLPRPKAVSSANDRYWADRDYYYRFREDRMQKHVLQDGSLDRKFMVDSTVAYSEFRQWFKLEFPNFRPPNGTIFRTEMETKLGKLESNVWTGWELMNTMPMN